MLEKLQRLDLLGEKPWEELAALFEVIKSAHKSPRQELDALLQRFLQGMMLNLNPLDLLSALKSSDE